MDCLLNKPSEGQFKMEVMLIVFPIIYTPDNLSNVFLSLSCGVSWTMLLNTQGMDVL